MGRLEDKIQKHRVAADATPGMEDLEAKSWTGDHGLTVVEMAPYGVVGAITPSTHPVPTMVNNAICVISAGNSAVFNVHPGAKDVSMHAVRLLNQAIVQAGGPVNLLTACRTNAGDGQRTLHASRYSHPVGHGGTGRCKRLWSKNHCCRTR